MVGSLLAGRYRLDEEIGQGGMATVYRAFDRSLERSVAVKVLHDDLARDEATVGRFRAEAQAAARLSHPSIVQIFDTGEDSGHYFIVMEYLPELDLKGIIRNYAPLPANKVAEVAMAACEGLGYAHQHGLIHRDVKPHNILFTADGRAKLTDFGIAAAIGDRSTEVALLGSAHYISPEEVHGNAPSPQSDLYSLGVVMYECLTGRTPFQGETAEAVLAKRLASPPPAPRSLNPNIPPAAEHVVVRAMARDPAQRYQSAGEMLADLRRLAAGAPIVAGTPPSSADATQTMVLTRPSETVSTPIMREAPPGPRQPPLPARRDEGAPGWVWGAGGVLLGLVALVGVVILLKFVFYPGAQAPALVQVPGVTGMSRDRAKQALVDAQLALGTVTEKPTKNQPAGTVIEQEPPMAELVPKGTKVDVVVAAPDSGEQEVVPVPDVVGLQADKARTNLQMLDLQVTLEEVSDNAPLGQVLKQSIQAGIRVAKGQTVTLTVSKGPEAQPTEPTEPTVPEKAGGVTEAGVDAEPKVDIEEDTGYAAEHPGQRKFDVTVLVRGRKPGQMIEIMMSDENGKDTVVHSGRHDPGKVVEESVYSVGEPTIEVHWEGNMIERYPS